MKRIRGKIIIVSVVLFAALVVFVLATRKDRHWHAPPQALRPVTNAPAQAATPPPTATNPLDSKRIQEMTEADKLALEKKFKDKLKPAVQRWAAAYGSRVPFNVDDLTLDKFTDPLGKNPSFYLYTFVLGDITISVEEAKDTTKVMYMMSRKAAVAMNSLPAPSTVPDLTTPITRDEVIADVKADSGVEFKPNEVIIQPSAKSGALNGGAFVRLIPTGANPNNGLSAKIDFVVGPDGKLANYDRDPFF